MKVKVKLTWFSN